MNIYNIFKQKYNFKTLNDFKLFVDNLNFDNSLS